MQKAITGFTLSTGVEIRIQNMCTHYSESEAPLERKVPQDIQLGIYLNHITKLQK